LRVHCSLPSQPFDWSLLYINTMTWWLNHAFTHWPWTGPSLSCNLPRLHPNLIWLLISTCRCCPQWQITALPFKQGETPQLRRSAPYAIDSVQFHHTKAYSWNQSTWIPPCRRSHIANTYTSSWAFTPPCKLQDSYLTPYSFQPPSTIRHAL
jgi:hypothetical protein